ncbi:unnamed protein product [Peniophora sp. CBMAI 1063]|nr:unnamed protein product [Peniophora sp. CBMAI 1063]
MLLANETHPGVNLARFVTVVELLESFRDAIAEHLEEYDQGIDRLQTATLEPGSDLCGMDCHEDHRPRKRIFCDIPPRFMSCELLVGERCELVEPPSKEEREEEKRRLYEQDVDEEIARGIAEYELLESRKVKEETPPVIVPDLSHDMESFFWILAWLCIHRAGPSRARTFELGSPDFSSYEALKKADSWSYYLYDVSEEHLESAGRWKQCVLDNFLRFEDMVSCVHPYFRGIITVLRQFHRDLHVLMWAGNRTHENAVIVGNRIVEYIGKVLLLRRTQTWDEEPGRGGDAIYNEARQREMERRREEGWFGKGADQGGSGGGTKTVQ